MKNFKRFVNGVGAPEFIIAHENMCPTKSESEIADFDQWYCTREAGHAGEHAAGGATETFATWED